MQWKTRYNGSLLMTQLWLIDLASYTEITTKNICHHNTILRMIRQRMLHYIMGIDQTTANDRANDEMKM